MGKDIRRLWAKTADDKLIFFFLFFPENSFDISCKMSPEENKSISKCRLLEILPSMLSVNTGLTVPVFCYSVQTGMRSVKEL